MQEIEMGNGVAEKDRKKRNNASGEDKQTEDEMKERGQVGRDAKLVEKGREEGRTRPRHVGVSLNGGRISMCIIAFAYIRCS